ncbi:MAG: phosphodiester glycosidase family protein [Oscillospiraceae bacterium]|nr:phosphodiester glycosidase family protein [Oscillospiraceae bacterium]MCR4758991.1 phosphodiester glycosidase family protein [Oscillospiraceae bacterium]
MAKRRRRKNRYATLGIRTLILVLVTLMLFHSGCKKLGKIASDPAYPIASRQYTEQEEAHGRIRALRSILSGKAEETEENNGNLLMRTASAAPEYETVELKAPLNESETKQEQPETELIDINRGVFRGKLLRIKDASRVYIGVSGPLGEEHAGKQLGDIVRSYGALAGVNASGFYDPDGMGNGGTPLGLVISQGKMAFGYDWMNYEVIGFDKKNKLHCGYMTGRQAMDMGIRDAACFGPVLISEGKRMNTADRWSGHNPRTVIGQTDDGTVLILLIEGRQISSIGATFDDVKDLMEEYGAVNAGNMDGGASSVMYYNGEQITLSSSLNGTRDIPSCWLVAPES